MADTMQRPGVRGRLRTCPCCGKRQVRWTAPTTAPWRPLLWCHGCGANAYLSADGRENTREGVEAAVSRMTRARRNPSAP